MDNGLIQIITVLIPTIPALIGAITAIKNKSEHRMLFSKLTILALISDDRLNMHKGKLPNNRESILHEFDIYKANGGNSYVHSKIDEYLKDIADFENNMIKKEEK